MRKISVLNSQFDQEQILEQKPSNWLKNDEDDTKHSSDYLEYEEQFNPVIKKRKGSNEVCFI